MTALLSGAGRDLKALRAELSRASRKRDYSARPGPAAGGVVWLDDGGGGDREEGAVCVCVCVRAGETATLLLLWKPRRLGS